MISCFERQHATLYMPFVDSNSLSCILSEIFAVKVPKTLLFETLVATALQFDSYSILIHHGRYFVIHSRHLVNRQGLYASRRSCELAYSGAVGRHFPLYLLMSLI